MLGFIADNFLYPALTLFFITWGVWAPGYFAALGMCAGEDEDRMPALLSWYTVGYYLAKNIKSIRTEMGISKREVGSKWPIQNRST